MNTVFIDPAFGEAEARRQMYGGQLIQFTPNASTNRIVMHGRSMLEDAFPCIDPCEAQHTMPVEEFARILIALKPLFIHHQESWTSIAAMLLGRGYDAERTYLDVPRLRISTSDGYLTSGVAYAHHPHRDTWWAAPMQQINWWMPLYDFSSESSMAFHPVYWERPTVNDSSLFRYADWNTNQRKNASQHVASDTRWQPHALEPLDLLPEVRLVCAPGGAIAFSGAQLHSTVPNTSGRTRFSIDFRTVDIDDVIAGRGAPNVDSAPAGTSLRDFKRLSDGARVPEEIAAGFDGAHAGATGLIYQPV